MNWISFVILIDTYQMGYFLIDPILLDYTNDANMTHNLFLHALIIYY